jgi:hypothetical protein
MFVLNSRNNHCTWLDSKARAGCLQHLQGGLLQASYLGAGASAPNGGMLVGRQEGAAQRSAGMRQNSQQPAF